METWPLLVWSQTLSTSETQPFTRHRPFSILTGQKYPVSLKKVLDEGIETSRFIKSTLQYMSF